MIDGPATRGSPWSWEGSGELVSIVLRHMCVAITVNARRMLLHEGNVLYWDLRGP